MATYHSLQGSLEEFIDDPNNTFDTNLVERVKTNSIRGPLELVLKTGDSYATFKVFLKEVQDAPKITFEDDAKTFLGISQDKVDDIIAKAMQSVKRE